MSSSFYMILDMLVAMADLGYGGPKPARQGSGKCNAGS